MKKEKVLVIATSSRTRGGITAVINAYKQTKFWGKWDIIWIETHIDKSHFIKLCYFLRAFAQFLYHISTTDLVHLHFSEPVSAIRKIPFIIIINLLNKKLIVHFHSFSTKTTILSKFSSVYKYIFSSADRVILLSEYWREEFSKKWPELNYKSDILYNPCLPVNFVKENKENIILYAGTLNSRKGYSDLLQAFALVYLEYPSWKLVFAGNGEIQKAQHLAHDLHIESNTHFLGWLNGEEKRDIFQKASIFCLPSYAEGFPMSVLDAFSFGLPIITTPVGGIPDVLTNSVNALIFNQGDIKSLSLCLKRLIDDSVLRDSLANSSIEFACTSFNIEIITEKLHSLYLDTINETVDQPKIEAVA